MAIKIRYNEQGYQDLEKSFIFNGGEVHVEIPEGMNHLKEITVEAFIHNSDDVMTLLMVKDAIDREFVRTVPRFLVMPYIPYARQDRVCNEREAFSIKVFADLINSMNFDLVVVLDPHSDVSPALINNCSIIPIEDVLDRSEELIDDDDFNLHHKLTNDNIILISPDAGAEKKVLKVSQHYGGLQVIYAGKIRDTKTGEIVATKVDWGYSLRGKDVLIVDDICDGGRTFIELAKKLRRFKPQSINLYVTHGIFSKGYQPLFDAKIKRIFTTDSFPQTKTDGVKVIEA
jgi:ribose-phosphate pyrophosphokinase